MSKVTLKAYAKINITLDILRKMPNGYHELKSIMQSVSLCDILRAEPAESGIMLCCDRGDIPTDSRNLVVKAAKCFFEHHGIMGGVSFALEKHIPSQAGMGGGSADCAAALIALDMLFETHTPVDELLKIGASLGADVPFCLVGGTKICGGVGERLTEISSLPDCFIVVCKPDVSVSTPEAYAAFDRLNNTKHSDFSGVVSAFKSGSLADIGGIMFNSFEQIDLPKEIFAAKERLLSLGAVSSLMTGSGSAVYGIFYDEKTAENARDALTSDYEFCKIVRPVSRGVGVESYE